MGLSLWELDPVYFIFQHIYIYIIYIIYIYLENFQPLNRWILRKTILHLLWVVIYSYLVQSLVVILFSLMRATIAVILLILSSVSLRVFAACSMLIFLTWTWIYLIISTMIVFGDGNDADKILLRWWWCVIIMIDDIYYHQ